MKLRIGSRESRLAVIQSQMVMELIAAAEPEAEEAVEAAPLEPQAVRAAARDSARTAADSFLNRWFFMVIFSFP